MRRAGMGSALLLGAIVLGGSATPAALASGGRHATAASYAGKMISFSYPAGWKLLPAKQAQSLGETFASAAKGTTLQDVAAISKQTSKNSGVVAVVLKAAFSKKLQGQLKGHHDTFMTGFVNGLTKSTGITVLSKKAGKLNGQTGQVVDVLQKSGASAAHEEFVVSLAPDDKSLYLALYLAQPKSVWNAYAGTFASINRSVHIK